jgi:hypothetical protein
MSSLRRSRFPAPLLAFAALTAALAAQTPQLTFAEQYAFGKDRRQAIAMLAQGSPDWFYYNCRERLDARDFATVQRLLTDWIARHDRSQQTREIENRLLLLGFDNNPSRTFAQLRERLNLTYQQQRELPGESTNLPTRLDPAVLSPAALTQQALAMHAGSVDGFTDAALPGLAAAALDPSLLRSLLTRLRRPDIDNLPALVIRDLGHAGSRGWASLQVHGLLRLEQLEECLRLRPQLLQDSKFVDHFLVRLQPGEPGDWTKDPAARSAQFARLWQFAQRLLPSFNSLKAHILHHWLRHDLSQGAPDKERFLAYIRLPRRENYPSQRMLEHGNAAEFVNLRARFATGLPAIAGDEGLLRDCLEHFFASEDSPDSYAEYLDIAWLRKVLAETKILLGQGDLERWYTMLGDRSDREQLAQRVELRFAPTQPQFYGANERVKLDVDVKNVPTLLVRVFAIDSYRYHQEKQREVDATIDLDGVVANRELTFNYSEAPTRRVRRSFELPELQAPGIYVVEFVGNGISSRAVVHKGNLRCAERSSAAGQLFRVYDETGQHLRDAALWFAGVEYQADARGEILLPFSTAPGNKQVVLRHGNRSSLAQFAHRQENYNLGARIHIEREQLIAGREARLLLRPQLRLNGRDVALSLLREPKLKLTAVDLDGIRTTREIDLQGLADDREYVHTLPVPERLQTLSAQLVGSVRDLAGKDLPLASEAVQFELNGIDQRLATSSVLLVPTLEGFAVEMRGKNGEPKAGQTVNLQLSHRDVRQPIQATLQTDANGRVQLGGLPGITAVTVQAKDVQGTVTLPVASSRWPQRLHGRTGDTLRLAYPTAATQPTRAQFSLLGHASDAFAKLALGQGFLELRDLAPGQYQLHLHEFGVQIPVTVLAAQADGEWLLAKDRIVYATPARPLGLRNAAIEGEELVIRLQNHSTASRVHVAALRYLADSDALSQLAPQPAAAVASHATPAIETSYHAGRKLGDEYRYILERRFAPKFVGNMLRRPSLLVNAWQLDQESRNEAVGLGGGAGGRFGGRAAPSPGGPATGGPGGAAQTSALGKFANLDYLPAASAVLPNLVPNAEGIIRIPVAALGSGQWLQILAVDGEDAVQQGLLRAEQPLQPRQRALQTPLDATAHHLEQKRIEFVAAGANTTLGDARATEAEVYDTLAGAFQLLATVSGNTEIARFAFLLRWPSLPAAERQQLYTQHACHELHFFLYHKDRQFFDEVCRPLLQHKRDKTFLDHWLLGADLTAYTEPWAFGRLNLIEMILLAQRLGESDRPAVARRLREALELQPLTPQYVETLFRLALEGNRLQDASPERLSLGKAQTGSEDFFLGRIAEGKNQADKSGVMTLAERGPADTVPPGAAAPRQSRGGEPSAGMPEAELQDRKAGRPDAPAADSGEWLEKAKEDVDGARRNEEAARRGQARQLYRAVQPTKLFLEHNYWHRTPEQTTPDVVPANQFWLDYALAPSGQPFVSPALVQANQSTLEMLMALAVTDLPFTAGKHQLQAAGEQRTLQAATPLLLVKKEIQRTDPAANLPPLLVGQNLFRYDDRHRYENGEAREHFITEEFLVDVVYGCQVVVSNPTANRRVVELLMQIPAGSVPVQRGFWTRGQSVTVEPYATQKLEYAFYFPAAGEYTHYPVHAAEKGKLAAFTNPQKLRVVLTPTQLDTGSWEHVSQRGTNAEVLAFLDRNNLQRVDFERIGWRLRDREFYVAVMQQLRARHHYNATVWSHGLLHEDAAATREYLRHQDDFVRTCGRALQSPLLVIDPVERGDYRHLELDPLVHQRVHPLSGARRFGNRDLERQYNELLTVLGYQPQLQARDWLAVTYYLLLQDRIGEAIEAFGKVDAGQVQERIQYDYLAAYLAFYSAAPEQARRIAERYREYPVPHWQQRFATVLAHLDEAEGKTAPSLGEPQADALAATAPALELELDGKELVVRSRNLQACELRYSLLDVEFAFSSMPFAATDGQGASYVQPNLREQHALGQRGELRLPLPAAMQQQNVRIEVRAGGLSRMVTHYANALAVRFAESQGQVLVTVPETGKPLPKAYVKVFAKLPNGQVRFHKDGYTDLRGRFDYASVSDDPNAGAVRYAVLVLDEQRGAVIRELNPPAQ